MAGREVIDGPIWAQVSIRVGAGLLIVVVGTLWTLLNGLHEFTERDAAIDRHETILRQLYIEELVQFARSGERLLAIDRDLVKISVTREQLEQNGIETYANEAAKRRALELYTFGVPDDGIQNQTGLPRPLLDSMTKDRHDQAGSAKTAMAIGLVVTVIIAFMAGLGSVSAFLSTPGFGLVGAWLVVQYHEILFHNFFEGGSQLSVLYQAEIDALFDPQKRILRLAGFSLTVAGFVLDQALSRIGGGKDDDTPDAAADQPVPVAPSSATATKATKKVVKKAVKKAVKRTTPPMEPPPADPTSRKPRRRPALRRPSTSAMTQVGATGPRRRLLALPLAFGLVVGACGGSRGPELSTEPNDTIPTTERPSTTTSAPEDLVGSTIPIESTTTTTPSSSTSTASTTTIPTTSSTTPTAPAAAVQALDDFISALDAGTLDVARERSRDAANAWTTALELTTEVSKARNEPGSVSGTVRRGDATSVLSNQVRFALSGSVTVTTGAQQRAIPLTEAVVGDFGAGGWAVASLGVDGTLLDWRSVGSVSTRDGVSATLIAVVGSVQRTYAIVRLDPSDATVSSAGGSITDESGTSTAETSAFESTVGPVGVWVYGATGTPTELSVEIVHAGTTKGLSFVL